MPSQKKARANPQPEPEEEEPEDEEDAEEEEEEEDAPGPPEEEEEEDAEEDAENEDEAERRNRLRRSLLNSKRKARQNGYRFFATQAGCAVGKESYANDIAKSLLSPSDVARLAHWCPESATDIFCDLAQFKRQIALRKMPLTSGPLKVLTANVESLARNITKDAVMRSLESNGPAAVTVANMNGALRPFANALHIADLLMPHGVARTAQLTKKTALRNVDGKKVYVEMEETVLPRSENTEYAIAEERKFAKQNHARLLKEAEKCEAAERDQRKRKRLAKESEAAPAAATATVG